MINFNQLRVFYHAARYENFTMAAEKLFITQPAVTAQIKLFEEHCNLKLFKKKGRKIYLTDEGKILSDYARQVFDYEKEIDDAIEDLHALKRGMLRLGTTKTYARYFMPFMMTSFHETYPQVKIHLDEGSSQAMTLSLLEIKNEVAVIAKAVDHPDVHFIPFSQEELVFILSPEHPLAVKKTVSFKDLKNEPIIMKEIGSGTRKLVDGLFEKNGIIPSILMETSNTEFIKQLVQRGDGLSFVVREAVARELQEGKLATVPIEGKKIYLDVSIAYLKGQRLSPSAQAFLDILAEMAPKKGQDQGIRAIMAKVLDQWK
ncbi:MAG: LysR family transcriptional regulator [Deltaproteobacteria bacterium]|nr:LysR family transcriptional regulator [Deltaproteobacteria bacterium]